MNSRFSLNYDTPNTLFRYVVDMLHWGFQGEPSLPLSFPINASSCRFLSHHFTRFCNSCLLSFTEKSRGERRHLFFCCFRSLSPHVIIEEATLISQQDNFFWLHCNTHANGIYWSRFKRLGKALQTCVQHKKRSSLLPPSREPVFYSPSQMLITHPHLHHLRKHIPCSSCFRFRDLNIIITYQQIPQIAI